MKAILELYEKRIFSCERCKSVNPYTVNVYREKNQKCDAAENLYVSRRLFLKEYLSKKKDVTVMIVGQSPGFLGCGFSGIPFTSEYNAIEHLGLSNHHKTKSKYQTEQSANNLYDVLDCVASLKNTTVSNISSRILMSNAFQCIPSDQTCKALSKDSRVINQMAQNCKPFLEEQIGLVKPKIVLCLGEDAWKTVAKMYNIFERGQINKDTKLTSILGNKYSVNGMFICPLMHPSPHNQSKDLYPKSTHEFITTLSKYL